MARSFGPSANWRPEPDAPFRAEYRTREVVSLERFGSCTFTFVEPSSPDVFEGTFSAVLYLATKQMDFAATEGRFRYPRWKEAGP